MSVLEYINRRKVEIAEEILRGTKTSVGGDQRPAVLLLAQLFYGSLPEIHRQDSVRISVRQKIKKCLPVSGAGGLHHGVYCCCFA